MHHGNLTMSEPAMKQDESEVVATDLSADAQNGRKVGKLDVLVQGVALFSDGYNIQVIGYMNSILAKL